MNFVGHNLGSNEFIFLAECTVITKSHIRLPTHLIELHSAHVICLYAFCVVQECVDLFYLA